MNTNMTGIRCVFQKSLHPCALNESSLSSRRVTMRLLVIYVAATLQGKENLCIQLFHIILLNASMMRKQNILMILYLNIINKIACRTGAKFG